jgi:putative ABC transport system permease protein
VLVAGCAAVAFVLAVVGVYSVKSYLVARRTREIGIRMALGAQPSGVLRLIVGEGLALAAAGAALGTVAAFGLTRWMGSLLFSVSPTDPLTFVAVPAVLTVVALTASYLPARRATRVDPVSALRAER